MSDYLVTAPATEPIDLTDVKLHIRHDASIGSAEDTLLTRLIKMARERAEHLTQRPLVTQTWGKALDAFPCAIVLPKTPLISVTWVKYLDSAGALQTVSTADYVVDSRGLETFIVPAYTKTWPSTYPEINAVTVEYVCGYGAAAAVPECVKDWMLLIIEDAYRNRGATLDSSKLMPNPFLDCLLDPIRIIRF